MGNSSCSLRVEASAQMVILLDCDGNMAHQGPSRLSVAGASCACRCFGLEEDGYVSLLGMRNDHRDGVTPPLMAATMVLPNQLPSRPGLLRLARCSNVGLRFIMKVQQ